MKPKDKETPVTWEQVYDVSWKVFIVVVVLGVFIGAYFITKHISYEGCVDQLSEQCDKYSFNQGYKLGYLAPFLSVLTLVMIFFAWFPMQRGAY